MIPPRGDVMAVLLQKSLLGGVWFRKCLVGETPPMIPPRGDVKKDFNEFRKWDITETGNWLIKPVN
jgi:hypothetical protein